MWCPPLAMGVSGNELSVKGLVSLVDKIEALAKKAKTDDKQRRAALAYLERVERELKSKQVLALAQQQHKAGKRLKRLEKHECQEIADTAKKVTTKLKDRFRTQSGQESTRVEASVAKFKEVTAGKDRGEPVKTKVDEDPQVVKQEQKNAVLAAAAKADPFSNARKVVKKAFLDGLLLACGDAGRAEEDAERVATELEEELSAAWNKDTRAVSKEYKAKYRSLAFNLKDNSNPDLRRRVLLGEIACKDIVHWKPQQMASDKRKEDDKEIKKTAMLNAQARAPTVSSTDQFKCGKCGKRKCTYYQMQTRSADEPMTTFVTCTVCNNRWKFS